MIKIWISGVGRFFFGYGSSLSKKCIIFLIGNFMERISTPFIQHKRVHIACFRRKLATAAYMTKKFCPLL